MLCSVLSFGTFLRTAGAYRWVLFAAVSGAVSVLSISCAPQAESEQLNPSTPAQLPAITSGRGIVIDIESKSQFGDIIEAGGICVLLLYSDECGPCRFVEPIMLSLADKYAEKVTVCRLDVDRNQFIWKLYPPKGYPTVVIIRDGREAERFLGPQPESHYIAALDRIITGAKQ